MLRTSPTSILFHKPDLSCLNVTVGDNEQTRGDSNYLGGILSVSRVDKCLLLGLCFSIRGVD